MKTIAMIAAGALLVSTAAYAQEAGAPGATGVSGPLTGSNTGSGYAPNYYNGPYGNGYGYGYNEGWNNGYPANGYVYDTPPGVVVTGPLIEGRAVAPDYDYDYAPRGVWGYRDPPNRRGIPNTEW